MDITVKIVKILPPQSGVSKRTGEMWKKFFFVGETTGQYQKKVAFSMFGEDRWKQAGVVEGCLYCVSFDPESREYNEKWFTELNAWKIVAMNGQQNAGSQAQGQSQPAAESPFPSQDAHENGGSYDDVPF